MHRISLIGWIGWLVLSYGLVALYGCGGNTGTKPTNTLIETPAPDPEPEPEPEPDDNEQRGIHEASTLCPQGRRIVGYYPSWASNSTSIQYSYLSHILYAFALPNADGSLMNLANREQLASIVTMAQGENVKVGIAIGGWNNGDDSHFVALAKQAESRQRFIDDVITLIRELNLDGVDIDWEYPSNDEQAEHYALLIAELREALDTMADEKFLSAAVVAAGDWAGQYIRASTFDHFDFINLMAYDENNANHSTLGYAIQSLDYWTDRGVEQQKLTLGVPFYARPSWNSYANIIDNQPANACQDKDADNNYYNGLPTIREKVALANEHACGTMIWEISQDTQGNASLLKGIWEEHTHQTPSYLCD